MKYPGTRRFLLLTAFLFLINVSENIAAADTAYVGVEVCAQCHADQVNAWRGSHHDLAMQKATATTVLGDFNNAEFTHFGVTSRFYKKEDGFFVNTEGADGQLTDFEVNYTFGIDPLQQYLIEFDDGRLQALSIAWDARPEAAGGQKWFHLYPGEKIAHDDPLHWTGVNQNWNFMCAECHSTNLKRNYDSDSDRYNTTWSELNVSCEACHGPGAQHIEWTKTGDEADRNYGLAVDLGRTGNWRINEQSGVAENPAPAQSVQIETCARCHSRRIVLSEDYQHGKPLINTYRPQVLLENLYHADGQILDEVYVYGSFIQSKMYDKGVTCTDCHDPHTLKLKAQGNALCGTCHLASKFDTPEHHLHQQASEAAECVSCHMPARLYMVHDSRRDHSFRVPRPDLSDQTDAPNVCTSCHQGRSPKWAADVIRDKAAADKTRAMHYGVAIQAGRSGALDAETQLIKLAENRGLAGIVRATGATLLGNYLSPVSIQTIAGLLQDEDPLVRVNALSALEGLEPQLKVRLAADLLADPERTVKIEAANLLADVPGELLNKEQRLAFGEAIDEYIEVQESNADRAESWTNLGNLYLRLGNAEKALAQYKHAIELSPSYVPAYVNLADLYRVQQRDKESEQVMLAGIAKMPTAASLRHSYGLLLVRQNKVEQAMEEFKRAVELEPRNVRFRYVYGVALSSAGNLKSAIAELESANAIYPADRDVLVALINFHQQNGDLDSARQYAQNLVKRAPWDRNAQALLNQLSN